MAHVRFWMFPDEEPALLRYLLKTGDIVACPRSPSHDPADFEPRPLVEYIADGAPERICIAPREFMDVPLGPGTFADGAVWYSRGYRQAPVISYIRPRFRAPGELGGSNMCTTWDVFDLDTQVSIRKPEAFIQWAQRVFRWVRRFTPQWHEYKGYRVTDRVAAAIADGLRIVP